MSKPEQAPATVDVSRYPLPDAVWLSILDEVCAYLDIEYDDLDPLYDAINPDALGALFQFDLPRERAGDAYVAFPYMGLLVTLFNDGRITLIENE